MQASERVVYGRAFRATPLWLWLVQRASGVLLGPLVLLHMGSAAMAAHPVLNALLLAVVLGHGYAGLRRVAVRRERLGTTMILALSWCVVVAAFGLLLVFAHA